MLSFGCETDIKRLNEKSIDSSYREPSLDTKSFQLSAKIEVDRTPNLKKAVLAHLIADMTDKIATSPSNKKNQDIVHASASGEDLYETHCASCHGDLSRSSKLGASPTRIIDGINLVPKMANLHHLTASKIHKISEALSTNHTYTVNSKTRWKPIAKLDGPALYTNNCALCHGSLAESFKRGTSKEDILRSISQIPQMSGLGHLDDEMITKIAAALDGPQDDGRMEIVEKAPRHQSPIHSTYSIYHQIKNQADQISKISKRYLHQDVR